jgi:hypothetical protein
MKANGKTMNKKVVEGFITEEIADKYLKSLVKQMLQVRQVWTDNNRTISTANIGYSTVKKYIEDYFEKRMPEFIDKAIDKYLDILLKKHFDKLTLSVSARKAIDKKFEGMLLKYLDNLPEKERTSLMMKYLMCRK